MEDLQSALLGHGLTVASLPGKGRGLIATRDFSPGDVIFLQEPYASTPNSFFVGRNCDGCFVSENLKKCSACRIAWYCGSTCQKSEWKLHKLECPALATLGQNRRKMLTPSIRLMVRLLLKRKLQSEQVIPRSSTDNYDLVEALVSHMSDIDEKQLILYAQMANLVKLVLPSLDISIKEVVEIFSKLSCNAHTISDSELRPLGTGLYPVISTINHSCLPNSVLVFEGRVAMVRAMKPIAKGTEVSISYIETAATTMKRLKSLKEQYFFTCMCLRCIKHNQYEDLQEAAIMEGYRCKDKKCCGFLLHDSEKKQFSCQKCGLSRDQQVLEKGVDEVEQLSEKAAKLLSSCNYFEARALYKSIEQLEIKLFHSLSIHLMGTRENLLKITMELKDWTAALTYCRLTIPVYQRIYPSIHPMLGLQYYSCGKLEWLLGYTEAALKSFTRAVDVLQITHGTSTPFMRELLNKMEETRAEAAYKLAGSN